VVAHGKVLLENIKTRTQTTEDLSRRTDQKFIEDVDGFRVERLQFMKTFLEHAEFFGWS
jgi:hypothetical protein